MIIGFLGWLIIATIFGLIGRWMADEGGIPAWIGFALGFFLWFIGLLVVLLIDAVATLRTHRKDG